MLIVTKFWGGCRFKPCVWGKEEIISFLIYITTAAFHCIILNNPVLKFLHVLWIPTKIGKGKGQPITRHRWHTVSVGVCPYSFSTSALDGSGWPTSCPGHIYPRDRAPVPDVQEAGSTAGQVWTCMEKRTSLPPPRFEPRTVQHIMSGYADTLTPPEIT
jgi:hypothetical protein